MNNFNHSISEKIDDYNGQLIRVISIKIVLVSGRFSVRAIPMSVSVSAGTTTVESWTHEYSGNLKEMDAWFTTNAFTNIGSNIVTITVDDDWRGSGEILNVDISNFINLPPNTDPDVIDANNAWLQNILDNQAP